jgi:hypothetical protein
MENPRAKESDKITGDKFEPLIDQTINRKPARKGKQQRERDDRSDDAELDVESDVERYDDEDDGVER